MADAVLHALEPLSLLAALAGVLLGIVFGAIPGLTATLGIALLVPVTFLMSAEQGMIMLGGVYAGAIYGGSITAILLNIPGTPASAVSAWEGHAMAKQGQAPLALGISAASAGIGGVVSGAAMLLLTPLLASVALKFGPAEYVGLILFSLVIVVVMLKTSLVGNAIGAFLGLLLGTVGTDVIAGTPRFTAGFYQLTGGVGIVAVLIGLFCMSQAVVLGWESVTGRGLAPVHFSRASHGRRLLATLLRRCPTLGRATGIGLFLGILPAIGPETTPLTTHAIERRFSAERDRFGQGSADGLIAAETSMAANVGGSLIPLLALGIPGSGAAAVFVGALTLHGLKPGPLLFVDHPDAVYTFFVGFIFVYLAILLIGLFAARFFAVVLRVPRSIVATLVAGFSILGSYAINNSLFDVWIMLLSTLLAFALMALRIPVLPVVLGLILGPILEDNLAVSRSVYASPLDWLGRPIAATLFVLTLAILVASIWRRRGNPDDEAAFQPE